MTCFMCDKEREKGERYNHQILEGDRPLCQECTDYVEQQIEIEDMNGSMLHES